MTQLSVNVNKVALLRNTRTIGIPSVTRAAQICIEAGAHGITVHPRPDQRHIRPSDVYDLAEIVTGVEFNIEGNPFETGVHGDRTEGEADAVHAGARFTGDVHVGPRVGPLKGR